MAGVHTNTYNWVRLNVAGDGNCFYRSLYEAARLHWEPAVLDDLLRCLGLRREEIEGPAAPVQTRRILRRGSLMPASVGKTKDINFYKNAEDRFCRLARNAIAAKVRDASGAFLDTLGGDSPYNALVSLKNQLFQLQFDSPVPILKALHADIETELASNGNTAPVSTEFIAEMIFQLYSEYFSSATPTDVLIRLQFQAMQAYERDALNTPYVENTGFIQPTQYLRKDLTLDDFPKSLHKSFKDTWLIFLESMSAGFQSVFHDFTKFPKSRGEFAGKYAIILEKYGEFTTDIDITVLNAILVPCNLRVHITSTDAPKRVENPAPIKPIYVMLDAEGEHYNFLLVPSKYELAPAEYDLYGGYKPKPQFYSDDELFTADSVRIHGDSAAEVREEDNNSNNNSNNSNNNIINATLKTSRGGVISSKKRRVTRKKSRV
jgi:hypothetical protein